MEEPQILFKSHIYEANLTAEAADILTTPTIASSLKGVRLFKFTLRFIFETKKSGNYKRVTRLV